MKQLYSLFTATQFLKRIPCPKYEFKNEFVVNSILYYPVVGLIIGSLLTLGQILASSRFPNSVTAALLICLYVIISGGLHLDGFMVTVDGIISTRSKERILEITKDSSVGAHGVTTAIILF